MDYIIREIKKAEYDLLNDFLYEAIYIPDGVELQIMFKRNASSATAERLFHF